MTPLNDDEWRARFDELRADDRASMPSFCAQWGRAEAAETVAPRRRGLAPVFVAAAAVVVLTVGVVVRRVGDGERPQVAPLTITNWKSPTAGLLRTSGRELLVPPPILSSTLDGVIAMPVNHKGMSR
jgi:hypothetical protein